MDTATLQATADRQAITDVIYRYCRAMDRMDVELGYGIWHEDGVADYESHFQGSGRELIDFVCANHRKALAHAHQMSNIIIELDGDRASSESYVTTTMRVQQGEQLKQITVWARYLDRWSRRKGRWAIDKRTVVRDFDEMRDISPMTQAPRSRRDREDPSYSFLGGI